MHLPFLGDMPFNAWAEYLEGESKSQEGATCEDLPSKHLLVQFNTDKGLCGGVNSFITRQIEERARSLAT